MREKKKLDALFSTSPKRANYRLPQSQHLIHSFYYGELGQNKYSTPRKSQNKSDRSQIMAPSPDSIELYNSTL